MVRRLLPIATLVLLAGCSTISSMGCGSGFNRSGEVTITFGRNMGTVEVVSDADWARFVDEEVSPRLDGFTVVDGQGQWRDEDGQVIRERSKVLHLVLRISTEKSAEVRAIRAAYKARFHQEAVLLVVSPACATF